jgi:hypothetical protein
MALGGRVKQEQAKLEQAGGSIHALSRNDATHGLGQIPARFCPALETGI